MACFHIFHIYKPSSMYPSLGFFAGFSTIAISLASPWRITIPWQPIGSCSRCTGGNRLLRVAHWISLVCFPKWKPELPTPTGPTDFKRGFLVIFAHRKWRKSRMTSRYLTRLASSRVSYAKAKRVPKLARNGKEFPDISCQFISWTWSFDSTSRSLLKCSANTTTIGWFKEQQPFPGSLENWAPQRMSLQVACPWPCGSTKDSHGQGPNLGEECCFWNGQVIKIGMRAGKCHYPGSMLNDFFDASDDLEICITLLISIVNIC